MDSDDRAEGYDKWAALIIDSEGRAKVSINEMLYYYWKYNLQKFKTEPLLSDNEKFLLVSPTLVDHCKTPMLREALANQRYLHYILITLDSSIHGLQMI